MYICKYIQIAQESIHQLLTCYDPLIATHFSSPSLISIHFSLTTTLSGLHVELCSLSLHATTQDLFVERL